MKNIDSWYLENLVCPKDRSPLRQVSSDRLISANGCEYPIVDGIPIVLTTDVEQTIDLADRSLKAASDADSTYFIDTLGIDDSQRQELTQWIDRQGSADFEVDPVVQYLVAATNGILYRGAIGNLNRYPIPELRLPPGNGETLLDIGCSWGRWSIAAARKGYRPIGLDPSLGAVLAGRRVAQKFNLNIKFVVGDARYLPFKSDCFDRVFSYSVLQHFSKANVARTLEQIALVLKVDGQSLIQMPNFLGLRSLQHQVARGFKPGDAFDVRYWSVGELSDRFTQALGDSRIGIDGFFGLGIQGADRDLLPWKYQLVVNASERLTEIAKTLPFLKYFADSLYVESIHNRNLA